MSSSKKKYVIDKDSFGDSISRFTDPGEPVDFKRYSICSACSHRTREKDQGKKKTCKAFPGGIPDKFLSGKVDHTTPYDGDNGITFQPFTS